MPPVAPATPPPHDYTTCFRLTRQLLPYLWSGQILGSLDRTHPIAQVHLHCHPGGVHLSDNTEDVGLDGHHASRDLHRFAYKIFAFSCAGSTPKIAPFSNATFVPFDSYMKHASYCTQFTIRAL